MVKLLVHMAQFFPIALCLTVVKHREEDLGCKHRVAACLVHVALTDNTQVFAYPLQASIESNLAVNE